MVFVFHIYRPFSFDKATECAMQSRNEKQQKEKEFVRNKVGCKVKSVA